MKENESKSNMDLYNDQIEEIEFQLAMMCITIIRYISDYGKYLGIAVIHHLV